MRALLFALMGNGSSHIANALSSPDTEAMLQAIQLLGAHVEKSPSLLKVRGTGGKLQAASDVIHAHNSGQVLRFIGALAALSPHTTIITGDRSPRPVTPLLDGLSQLGATAFATEKNGFAPYSVKGPLQPGFAKFCGRDSQPVSAILIATSFLSGASRLIIDRPGELPWVNLTLHWLQKLGSVITHHQFAEYFIPGSLHYGDFSVTIPGDFSSAAYPLAAALLYKREATLVGLNSCDAQGDKEVISLLQKMGAKLTWEEDVGHLHIQKTPSLKSATVDVDPIIDALPILAAIGCYAEGSTYLLNARSARHKESDRLAAMTGELRKMGARIEEQKESLAIYHSCLHGALLDSHFDHRIAMALTIAALGASTPSRITGSDCISKSYPTFIAAMRALGFSIEVIT